LFHSWQDKANTKKSFVTLQRQWMSRTYESFNVQTFFAVVIAANFLVNIVEHWVFSRKPEGDRGVRAVS
jgi:hypothetical protein